MAQLQLATMEEKTHKFNVAILDTGEVKANLCLRWVGLSTWWDLATTLMRNRNQHYLCSMVLKHEKVRFNRVAVL